MRKVLIVGWGEVGSAHGNIIAKLPSREVRAIDVIEEKVPEKHRLTDSAGYHPDVLLIAIRYSEIFLETAKGLIDKYKAQSINVLTTVPVGTCEELSRLSGHPITHSTTRGIHPNLEEGLLTMVKHVGGPGADSMARFYGVAGIRCYTHPLAKTTEGLHILNNCHYGANIAFADEAQALCREWGIDYFDYMLYTQSNNDGYTALGMATKVRPVLTPPNGRIGGHCVTHSANLIPPEIRTPIIDRLASYGRDTQTKENLK